MSSNSTPNTHAHSAEKTPLEERLLVSGTARDAERQLPVVLGPSLLLLLPLSEGEPNFLTSFCPTNVSSCTDFGRCDVEIAQCAVCVNLLRHKKGVPIIFLKTY